MTVSFRPLALGEVLGLGRSIVRDFHPYELRGYRYARRDILRGRAVALAVTVGGAYAGYLIHEKPGRGCCALPTWPPNPGSGGSTSANRPWHCSSGGTPGAPSTLKWRTLPLPKTRRSAS